ncbi:MAG: Rpn family recombination-promoting nuclease/putative transposase [Candidatus Riflebacteria bacterium]|nr:Rpn family recombination-promoting nuclease/putative transposase [Candidatus Riflebacteria bacterium]
MTGTRRLVSFDWAIKKLLRSKANFEILEGFLSELTGEKVKIIEILESETNREHKLDKYSRIDLKTVNDKGEIILIEIQYNDELGFFHRLLYGISKTLSEHLSSGHDYSKVVKVISIGIAYFDLGQGEDYVYHGKTRFIGIHKQDELKLSLIQQDFFKKDYPSELYPELYLIKVNNFDDVARNTLDEWIYFLKNEEIKDDFKAQGIHKAKEELDIMKLSTEERREYEAFIEDLRFQGSMFQSSYGVGYKKGEDEGYKKGENDGYKKGEDRKAVDIAYKMLLNKVNVDSIADITGLSKEIIESLKKPL